MTEKIRFLGTVNRETARSATKLALIAVWLMVIVSVIRLLPGIEYLMPRTPVTIAAFVGAVITAVIVGVLVLLAPKLAALTEEVLAGPSEIIEHIASVVYWLAVLVAIIVAHRGFAGAVIPFLGEIEWLYDIGFLVLSLPPLVVIATRLYVSLEPISELFLDQLASSEDLERSKSA